MLERLAPLLVLNAVAGAACSGQSSTEPERPSGAAGVVFGRGASDAIVVRSAAPTTVTREAQCLAGEAKLPPNSGSPLWLQSYDARPITSVASDSTGGVVLTRSGLEVSKLSCAGTPLWSKPFGAQAAIDERDDVYVAGTFTDTLVVDDSTLRTDGSAAFVVKLDRDGNVAYARALGEATDGAIDSLAIDNQGQVALSGPGFGTVKLDGSGAPLWRKAFAGKVQFDSAGNLLLAGELVGTLDFGVDALTSAGGSDVLLLKLGPDGTPLFAHRYGDAAALQRAEALAVDGDDNVVVAGTFDGRVDFGSEALELTPAQCSSDAWCVTDGFVAKFDARGRPIWSFGLGPTRAVSGVAIDQNGNTVLSGAVPGGVRPFRQTWLAKLDVDGTEVWRRSEWPDTGIGAGHSVAVDRDAQVFWSLSARPSLALEEQFYLAKLSP